MSKKSAPQQGKSAAKKGEFVPEGKRLEDVKDTNIPKARLIEFYRNNVVPSLMKKYNYKSVMQVPKLEKICINIGVGSATQDLKQLQSAVNELELITGQRPVVKKAKKAISNFKLRQGMPIACMVTLRGPRMFEFLDRFINIASPRIRDFRGFPDKSFDGRGNYTIGIKEQIIFPELDVDKINKINGMDISFVMKSMSDEESYSLLSEFGFPFKKKIQ
ncbi:MAG TPA: 50S ribosomal protein L5 [Candidatus Kapabacteria bacterium]|nr:50S ribosomal protein L5 [Candidatus Kapabacteria bacterium]